MANLPVYVVFIGSPSSLTVQQFKYLMNETLGGVQMFIVFFPIHFPYVLDFYFLVSKVSQLNDSVPCEQVQNWAEMSYKPSMQHHSF